MQRVYRFDMYLHGAALIVHFVDAVDRLLRTSEKSGEHPEPNRQQICPRTCRCSVIDVVLARSGHSTGLPQQHLHQHAQHARPREPGTATLLLRRNKIPR